MSRDKMNSPKKTDLSTWSMIKRLAGTYLMPYRARVALALFFMAISAAMIASFAKLIEPVLDNVLVEGREDLIVPMAFAVFIVFVINGISTYLHTVLLNLVGQSIVADIQRDLFSRFMGLDLAFFQEHPSGQLMARMISDVNAVRTSVSESLTGMGKSFLTLVLLTALMFSQDWKLALIAFCIFPPAAWFVVHLGKRLRKVSGSIQMEVGNLSTYLSEVFQGIRQVKAYGMEAHEGERAGEAIRRVRRMIFKSVRIGNLSTPVNEALVGGALMGVIIYGGYQVAAGDLTVGGLMSFIAAFALAYEPLKRLAKLNNALQMGLGAGERVIDMLDRQAQITDRPGAVALQVKKPAITFDSVSFHYGAGEDQALDGVSFEIPAGKATALVGPSGGGKSTVMNLIPRFYDVTGGRILFDDADIRDVTLESLRRHIALVSQDITIFDDTVRANIAYGQPDASESEIMEAAKAAAADEFIQDLTNGYDTKLGEHGQKLSGGQRQRIAIARAILRDAPVLLLDEATSALDNESERLIQESLTRLQQGRTTLVIAHRLSTVQDADQIIVLNRGKVEERGTHETLLKQQGLYAYMHSIGLKA